MKNATKLQYISYRRKSSESTEKQVLSLEAQKRENDKFIEKENLTVVEDLHESASAYHSGRKVFNQMVKLVEAGKANAILVYHITRLARNMVDGGKIIEMLNDGTLKEVRTLSERYIKDSSMEFFLALQFAMSKKSSDDTSEFVKRDISTKLLKGEYPGFASLGYLNIDPEDRISGKQYSFKKQALIEERKKTKKIKRVEQDPILAPLIKKLFTLYATGQYTMNKLRDVADTWGLYGERSKKKLSKQTIQRILSNPFYYGAILFKKVVYEPEELPEATRHDPIISREMFNKCKEVMFGKAKAIKTEEFYPYSVYLKCGLCGKAISGTTAKGHHYYRCCNCSKNAYVREEELEKQMIALFERLTIDEEYFQLGMDEIRKENENEIVQRNAVASHRKTALSRTDAELDTLMRKYLSPANDDGAIISEEDLKQRKADILIKREGLKNEIENCHEDKMYWFEGAVNYVQFIYNLKTKFTKTTPEKKREVFQYVFNNPTLTNKVIATLAKNPHCDVIRLKSGYDFTLTSYVGEYKTKTEDITSVDVKKITRRSGRDSNP